MRRTLTIAIVLLAAALGAGPGIGAAYAEKRIVAVLPFYRGEGVSENQAELVYNLFTGELIRRGSYLFTLVVADAAQRARILKEIEYQASGFVRDEDVVLVGGQLGAQEVVFGQVVRGIEPDKVQITVNFSKVGTGTVTGMYSRFSELTDQGLEEAVGVLVSSILGRDGTQTDAKGSALVYELKHEELPEFKIETTQRIDAGELAGLMKAGRERAESADYADALALFDRVSAKLAHYLAEDFFKSDWPVCEQIQKDCTAIRTVALDNYRRADTAIAVRAIEEQYNGYLRLMRRDVSSNGSEARALRGRALRTIQALANADWVFDDPYVKAAYAGVFSKDIGSEKDADWTACPGAKGEVSTFSGYGMGSDARGFKPGGITTDGTSLYVTELGRIRKIAIATKAVTNLAIPWNGTRAGVSGITTDGADLYVTGGFGPDAMGGYCNEIRKIEIATGVVTTLAGSSLKGYADGTGADARFDDPEGITTDGKNLYVADEYNNAIRKIVIATGAVTTLAGSPSWGHADGRGAEARFAVPRGITTDGTNLYVTEALYNDVRRISLATGVVTTLAGSGAGGHADGKGTQASFYFPEGITTDGTNLYVADSFNNEIRKIVISTGVVTTLAGSPKGGGADGTAAAAGFTGPLGITTDGTSLYVTDSGNNEIREIR